MMDICLQELKKFLHGLLQTVEGLHSIFITDRDGVPVLSVASEKIFELSMRTTFLSTFGMASDQGSKLGLGKNKTIICVYSSYQVLIYCLILVSFLFVFLLVDCLFWFWFVIVLILVCFCFKFKVFFSLLKIACHLFLFHTF